MAKRSKSSDRPTPDAWAAKLKALRERRRLTQQEAADEAGVPVRTWIAWENRQHVPKPIVIAGLAATFPELA